MNTKNLLKELEKENVKIKVVGNNLKINAPKGVITSALKKSLTTYKKEIINTLTSIDKRLQKIEPIKRSNRQPLSFAQQRLWFISQFEENESIVYNIPMAFKLEGKLNIVALQSAFQTIVQRHENLRTTFQSKDGKPEQRFTNKLQLIIPIITITQQDTLKYANEHTAHVFDLSSGPLIKVCLLSVSPEEHILCINMHHIVSDGWSLGVLYHELAALYDAYTKSENSPLPPLPIQYGDFSHWQRQWLRGEILEQQVNYWKDQLNESPTLLELPTDRPRPAAQTYRGKHLPFKLASELTQKLKKLAREEGASLFMLLLAGFNILLARYSGQNDICVGTPIANRRREELESLIGFFVNTLVLRTRLKRNDTIKDVILQVKAIALAAFEHQDMPFEHLLEVLKPERNLSHSPLFQVMFTLQNSSQPAFELSGTIISAMAGQHRIAKFDLSMFLVESGGNIEGTIEYNTDLFDQPTIVRMKNHYLRLLENIVSKPGRTLSSLSLLSEQECQQQLVDWNHTQTSYPRDQCIHALFEEQAGKAPDTVAVVHKDALLTYEQLNKRSNQLAHYLIKRGVRPDTRLGLCLDRSQEMMIGILGILKAGGCYVPLDPSYPQQRIGYLLKDSDVALLLTQDNLLNITACDHEVPCLRLDSDWPKIAGSSTANTSVFVSPANLAYVIYTSGSTGNPKGVAVSHRAVNRLVINNRYLELSPKQNILQAASISFDAATFEIWGALLNGSQCILYPDRIPDAEKLEQVTIEQNIDTLWLTAALFNLIVDERPDALKQAKNLLIGGETVSHEHVMQAYKNCPALRIMNMYGPTESTTFTTYYPIPTERDNNLPTVPIGRPISNTTTYILDTELNPAAVRTVGELYIGGAGLARGYLGQTGLTAEKFVPNPFSRIPGERLYKTGDLARYLPDGKIDFIGRLDQQVKIRGFRIELAEIENALTEQAGVSEAVVLAHDRGPASGNRYLAAYVVCDEKMNLEQTTLRSRLKTQLPEHMIPAFFIFLNALPLTRNGKVNRKALPKPASDALNTQDYIPPRTEIEKQLVAIWSDILNLPADKIGIEDNFFELGGDSILSIQVASRAYKQGINISTRRLFEHQTINLLAQYTQDTIQSIPQQPSLGDMLLLPIQQWFLTADDLGRDHFTQSFLLHTPPGFDTTFLKAFIEAIYHRHDTLRLQFYQNKNQWRARFIPFSPAMADNAVVEEKLPETAAAASGLHAYLALRGSEIKASLNINGALLKAVHFQADSNEDSRLLLIIHHLVVDGVSWRVLLDDLSQAFEQWQSGCKIALAPKSSSYQQWSRALHKYSNSVELVLERPYWLASLSSSKNSLLAGAADTKSHSQKTTEFISFALSEMETEALLGRCHGAYRTQINDLLLAGLLLAFKRWGGLSSLRLRMEGHGREALFDELDLSHTVGWFTSIFPLTLHCEGSDCKTAAELATLITGVKEQTQAIPKRGIGYGVLRYLTNDEEFIEAEKNHNDEIVFNYLGQFDQQLGKSSLFAAAREFTGSDISLSRRRDALLGFNGSVTGACLHFTLDYNGQQFSQKQMKYLAKEFTNALIEIIKHCQERNQNSRQKYPGVKDLPYAWLNMEFEGFSFKQKFEPLVRYGSDKKKPTLFLIPPGDGGLESYINLVEHMTGRCNICLLENIEIASSQYYSLPSLTEYYINLIKREQPSAPYYIGGWSRGAILSHAVADRLINEGRQVGKLILMDPIGYTMDHTTIEKIRTDPEVESFDSENMSKLNRLLHIYQYSYELAKTPYLGDVIHFKANEGIFISEWPEDLLVFDAVSRHYNLHKETEKPDEPSGGLKHIFPNSKTLCLEGNHHTLLQENNLNVIAGAIDKEIVHT